MNRENHKPVLPTRNCSGPQAGGGGTTGLRTNPAKAGVREGDHLCWVRVLLGSRGKEDLDTPLGWGFLTDRVRLQAILKFSPTPPAMPPPQTPPPLPWLATLFPKLPHIGAQQYLFILKNTFCLKEVVFFFVCPSCL